MDAGADMRVVWAPSMADAERELACARPDCVLLDLHLPDADGIEALGRICERDATVPIVVLTGLNDEHFGVSAVASGAQDYLVKGRVEPEMLRRAVLYAIERKRAELTAVELHASQLRDRGERAAGARAAALSAAAGRSGCRHHHRVPPQPGERAARRRLLRFRPDAGPDGARDDRRRRRPRPRRGRARGGAAHRLARTDLRRSAGYRRGCVSSSGSCTPNAPARASSPRCSAWPSPPDQPLIDAVRAGHPGMLLHGGGTVEWVEPAGGPALGLQPASGCPTSVELPTGTGLVLLTDGLFEGHSGHGNRRLGEDGLLELARPLADLPGPAFVEALIDAAEQRARWRTAASPTTSRWSAWSAPRDHSRHRRSRHRRPCPPPRIPTHACRAGRTWCCRSWGWWCWRVRWPARCCSTAPTVSRARSSTSFSPPGWRPTSCRPRCATRRPRSAAT